MSNNIAQLLKTHCYAGAFIIKTTTIIGITETEIYFYARIANNFYARIANNFHAPSVMH
jgi:hypothetical protein